MPGFSEHLALKAKEKAEQERIEALRKMYPNQVPADVAFGIPNPQPGPEIVTFGRDSWFEGHQAEIQLAMNRRLKMQRESAKAASRAAAALSFRVSE